MNTTTATPVRAISVKYLPPTDQKGSRVKARLIHGGAGASLCLSYDYSENDGGKEKAANALLSLLKVRYRWNEFAHLSQRLSTGQDETIFTITE